MCTATWFHDRNGLELYFNRDERRSRAPAAPPGLRRRGEVRFVAPLDGDFGGTWIAVSERGLVVCLLNGYAGADPPPPGEGGFETRGALVASLIDSRTPDDLERRLRESALERFRSFALAFFDGRGEVRLAHWSSSRLRVEAGLDGREPLVSSSFEATAVRESRVALFHRLRGGWHGSRSELHRRYHASHCPQRGAYSPCMHRPDAHTVSFSRIVVGETEIEFHYTDGPPGDAENVPGPPFRLARAGGA